MAENNSFLQDMMGKGRPAQTAAASEPVSNRPAPKTKASNSYDVQSYGLLKLRLNDQRTQVKAMSDYSEDSAIKLNDIYEILKSMKPTSYVSSLDTYFSDNGYIPVKVLNPCCEEKDINSEKEQTRNNKKSFAEYATEFAVVSLQALAAINLMMTSNQPANADVVSNNTVDTSQAIATDPMGSGVEGMNVGQESTTDTPAAPVMPPVNTETIATVAAVAAAVAASTTKGSTTTRTVSEPPSVRATSKSPVTSKTALPESITKFQQNPFAPQPKDLTGGRGGKITPNIPNLGMPGQGGLGGGGVPGIFGDDEDGLIYDDVSYKQKSTDALGNYGITKDNTDNTILTARKINFVAKEITYEAGKFEFIDQTGVSASSGVTGGNGVSLASYTPPGAFASGTGNVTTYNMPSRRDGATNSYQVPATHDQMSAKESAVIDMISKREGVSGEQGYDMILGDVNGPGTSLLGVPPKPLTEMTLNELYDWQTQMLNNPNNRWNSSAAGAGQFVRTTLFGKNRSGGLLAQMGITPDLWGTTKFDKTLQDMLILQNFKDNVGDPTADPSTWNMTALGAQWQSFMFKPLNQNDVNALRGVTAQTNKPSNLGPHADITSKSSSTAMQLNTPVKTTAPAVVRPSVINVSSPAYSKVDEPMAAWDDMFDRLLDQTLMYNV